MKILKSFHTNWYIATGPTERPSPRFYPPSPASPPHLSLRGPAAGPVLRPDWPVAAPEPESGNTSPPPSPQAPGACLGLPRCRGEFWEDTGSPMELGAGRQVPKEWNAELHPRSCDLYVYPSLFLGAHCENGHRRRGVPSPATCVPATKHARCLSQTSPFCRSPVQGQRDLSKCTPACLRDAQSGTSVHSLLKESP